MVSSISIALPGANSMKSLYLANEAPLVDDENPTQPKPIIPIGDETDDDDNDIDFDDEDDDDDEDNG